MNKIAALPSKNAKGHEDVIEILEQLLAEAKNGEIEALAVASVKRDEDMDKTCNSQFSAGYDNNGFILYTSVELMRDRLMRWMTGRLDE